MSRLARRIVAKHDNFDPFLRSHWVCRLFCHLAGQVSSRLISVRVNRPGRGQLAGGRQVVRGETGGTGSDGVIQTDCARPAPGTAISAGDRRQTLTPDT